MLTQGVPLFGTALHERDAFRAIFSFGGTLSDLDANAVGNVPAALNNARQFTAETIAMLKHQQQPAKERRTEVA
jgi:chromosome partitioning protein